MDSFVGRDRELDDLATLLPGCRLLTLTGPPGTGKTRLAVELVTRLTDRSLDRVWFVDLSSLPDPDRSLPDPDRSLPDPDRLRQSVGAALGVREQHGPASLAAWAKVLAGEWSLLLLDNCEHVAAACAKLTMELLECYPKLTVLCTSREVLGVPGEVAFPVGGLPYEFAVTTGGAKPPDPDAVRLFIQRASACRPDLVLTIEERRTVGELCAGLDGSPLAIELAARWVRMLPVAELIPRLSDRLDLLVAGPRTATDRQRSMRSALEWSHATLDGEERAVFRRLAVLAGWFDLKAATAVCAAGEVPAEAVLHVLASLEIKSLLVPSGSGQFRQLESIRLFAREQLEKAGELDETYDRLLDWLYRLAAGVPFAPLSTVPGQKLLEKHQTHLEQAVEWAIDHGNDRQVLLAVVLTRCWMGNGNASESVKLMERVLTAPRVHWTLALTEASFTVWYDGYCEQTPKLAERAVTSSNRLGDTLTLACALQRLATACRVLGDLEPALGYLEESLSLMRCMGMSIHTAMCLNDLAWTTIQHGRPDRAVEALAEALPMAREHDEPHKLASVLHTDAALALVHGDLGRAENNVVEFLRWPDLGLGVVLSAVETLAVVAARRGQAERALRLIGAAAALRGCRHVRSEPWWRRQIDEAESVARQLLAPDQAEAALAAGRQVEPDQVVAYAFDQQRPDSAAGWGAGLLTEREHQVAAVVAEGATNRQIGRRLGISERTVETHLRSIRERLSLPSRTAIAVWITEHRSQK